MIAGDGVNLMSSNGIPIPSSMQQSQGALSVVEDDYSQNAMLDEQVAKLQMESAMF